MPEIGRVLQTGPIASPGSFPSGTGGVGIVIAPYLGAAVSEFTEIAVRDQAASEEAKREEAEEKAKMEECPASECHVDGPGEGNCEVNCLTMIGEAEVEEGEQTLGAFELEATGPNSHTAGHIECAIAELNGLPHHSSHTPGLVNWVLGFACNGGIVGDVQIRLALFWEGEMVSETGYMFKGDTAFAKQSVQAPCVTGWYTGWYQVTFVAPPGYVGETGRSGWSKASRYVTCPT